MTKKITLKVRGIHCQSCVSLIKNNVNSLPGIVNVIVDIDSKKAEVIYDGKKTNESDVIEKIKKAGDYTVEQWDKPRRQPGGSCGRVKSSSKRRRCRARYSFRKKVFDGIVCYFCFFEHYLFKQLGQSRCFKKFLCKFVSIGKYGSKQARTSA